MSRPAYFVHKLGVVSACICLTAALLLTVASGGLSPALYERYLLIRELVSTGAAVLLIAVIGEVCIEEQAKK